MHNNFAGVLLMRKIIFIQMSQIMQKSLYHLISKCKTNVEESNETLKYLYLNVMYHLYTNRKTCGHSHDKDNIVVVVIITEIGTWSSEISLANWDNIPATKASPAPVVSTCSTFNPLTLPLKSYIITRYFILRAVIEGKWNK